MNALNLSVTKIITASVLLSLSFPLYAYIGPGAGLSALGTLLALIFGLLVAIIGFLWYPLKRLLRKSDEEDEDEDDDQPKPDETLIKTKSSAEDD